MCRVVIRPYEFRPPVRFLVTVSRFSGSVFVISSKVRMVMNRRPGDVGFKPFTGMALCLLPVGRLALEQLDLAVRAQRHDGLLPGRPPSDVPAHALLLAEDDLGPDAGHLDLEDRLHRVADLDLVGVGGDLEADLVVLVLERRGLLGHQRAQDDLSGVSHDCSHSCTRSSAWRSNTTRGWRSTPATATWFGRATDSHGMFRLPRSRLSVTSVTTRSVGSAPVTPRPRRRPIIALVFGSATDSPSTTVSWPAASLSVRAARSAARRACRGLFCT